MANKFCRYLSNGASFAIHLNKLVVMPCCWRNDYIIVDENATQNRIDKYGSVDDWTPECHRCHMLERAGQYSMRQSSFDLVPETETSADPYAIDIFLDIECNSACVTCTNDNSSLWDKELKRLKGEPIRFVTDKQLVNNSIEKIVSTTNLNSVKNIKFYGGEPLFSDTHLNFLQHIPNPSEVTIQYTTNGSIYPNEQVLKMWEKFKLIIFSVSIDGIEEQFDYVRWPLTWDKVGNNLTRLKNSKIFNLMFRVEFTANFLNTYYFDRLETWVNNNFKTNAMGDPTDLNLHQCWGVWDLHKMPVGIRQRILEKYPKDHKIYNLVNNLPEPMPLGDWHNFVETWDKRRNNSWKQAFPDLVDYITS